MNWFKRYVVAPVTITAMMLLPYGCGHQTDSSKKYANSIQLAGSEKYDYEDRKIFEGMGMEVTDYCIDGSWIHMIVEKDVEKSPKLTDRIRTLDSLVGIGKGVRYRYVGPEEFLEDGKGEEIPPKDDNWYPGYIPDGHADPPPPVNIPNDRPPF